jgi:hypothetical protein
MKVITKLQYIFLYALSLIIIGASTILTGELGFQLLTDPAYYINQGLTWAAILCVTFATLFAYIDKSKETNTEFLENEKYISDFASSKQNVPSIVSRFLEPFNRKRKIKQFTYNLHKQLYKLDNRQKFIICGPRVFNEQDFYIWNHGTLEEKQNNAYCKERLRIEEQLKEEYIEANIDRLVFDYDKVTTNILFGGIYQHSDNESPNDFITKNQGGKIAKYKIPQLLFSFGITLILSSLIFDDFAFNASNLINLAIKLAVLLWNCFTTLRYAETFFYTVTLKDSRFRKGVILEYEKWLQQEAQKVLEQDKLDIAKREVSTNDTRTIIEDGITQP